MGVISVSAQVFIVQPTLRPVLQVVPVLRLDSSSMGARMYGQEGALASLWKSCKVFLCIAQRSVNELFMHYFH